MEKIVPLNTASARANSSAGVAPPPVVTPASPATTAESLLVLHERMVGCAEQETLLQRFLTWAKQRELADGLSYCAPGAAARVLMGERRHHSSTYQLQLDGEHIGTLVVSRRVRYAESELMLLERALACLCQGLKLALDLQALRDLALRDGLTGLLMRKAMDERLAQELSRARRQGTPLSVMLVDVDHFKDLNDTLGHLGGDQVLRSLADIFENCTRDVDLVFRHGGDEFAIVLPDTRLDQARTVAERIRGKLCSLRDAGHADSRVQPDISIGVAQYVHGDDEQDLLQRADTHLYHAKAQGRGKVCTVV